MYMPCAPLGYQTNTPVIFFPPNGLTQVNPGFVCPPMQNPCGNPPTIIISLPETKKRIHHTTEPSKWIPKSIQCNEKDRLVTPSSSLTHTQYIPPPSANKKLNKSCQCSGEEVERQPSIREQSHNANGVRTPPSSSLTLTQYISPPPANKKLNKSCQCSGEKVERQPSIREQSHNANGVRTLSVSPTTSQSYLDLRVGLTQQEEEEGREVMRFWVPYQEMRRAIFDGNSIDFDELERLETSQAIDRLLKDQAKRRQAIYKLYKRNNIKRA